MKRLDFGGLGTFRHLVGGLVWTVAVAGVPALATAQAIPADGRASLFVNWSEREFDSNESADQLELIFALVVRPESSSSGLVDYALDARVAGYPSEERDERISLYEAWAGMHSRDSRWTLRLGQMWIRELGGVGAVGGAFGEYRFLQSTPLGSWRVGLFGGLEPQSWETGYVEDVTKGGTYVALDGKQGRRHVLGYVRIENGDATERSVVVFNNFVPAGRTFSLYQALEYDTQGPAGLGTSQLTYFLANLRYSPASYLDLQGTYHRGRSVNARSITEDFLAGRPVPEEALDGLRFESARIRVTARPVTHLSVWASYGQDRNNAEDSTRDALQAGASAHDLFGAGVDVTVASTRYEGDGESYTALNASVGATVGSRTYVTLDYAESLSVYQISDGAGGTIESRPDSTRWALSSNLNLSRVLSLLVALEFFTQDTFDERRLQTGIIFRF